MNSPFTIFGVGIFSHSLERLLNEVNKVLQNKDEKPLLLACANPHSLVISRNDANFHEALNLSNFLVADGVGVSIVGRYLKGFKVKRITGFDIFSMVMKELDRVHGSVFFFGSSSEVLRKIEDKVQSEFPSIRFAGKISPPFGSGSFSLVTVPPAKGTLYNSNTESICWSAK